MKAMTKYRGFSNKNFFVKLVPPTQKTLFLGGGGTRRNRVRTPFTKKNVYIGDYTTPQKTNF